MDIDSFRRQELNYFHKLGIASNDTISKQGWKVMTLDSIKTKLGHKGVKSLLYYPRCYTQTPNSWIVYICKSRSTSAARSLIEICPGHHLIILTLVQYPQNTDSPISF